jgi:hypothetical protein
MKMVSRIPLCLWPDGGIPADEWLSSPRPAGGERQRPPPNRPGLLGGSSSNSGNNSNNHIA